MGRKATFAARPVYARWVGLTTAAGVFLVADLGTKAIFDGPDRTKTVHAVTNDRMMFGLDVLRGAPLAVLSVAAGAIALLTAARLWKSARVPTAVLVLLMAGMVGNLADRISRGHVRDWLVIGPTRWNLADFYLAVAIPWVIVAAVELVRLKEPKAREVMT
jgi:lipoprotein signal peptidase